VAYRLYGSNEKGFSVSDEAHPVYLGRGFVHSMDEYENKSETANDAGMVTTESNFVAEVTATQRQVVGPGLSGPNCNRAFFRVVAIDSQGNRSGPSDYAATPRPFFYTRPPTPAKVGEPYRYEAKVIRSLGDLRCRRSPSSSYNAAFWDREEITFRAIRLPPGLTLNPQSGLVSGKPERSGEFPLVLEAVASSGHRATSPQRLKVVELAGADTSGNPPPPSL
jgi:hypothetical protein